MEKVVLLMMLMFIFFALISAGVCFIFYKIIRKIVNKMRNKKL